MTEIALAMAMGFFSVMVLTMMSMGVGLGERQAIDTVVLRTTSSWPDGSVSTSYAPPGVLPDLPRDQVPIASNLIIDREGKIRFYSLLDSRNFDAKLVALTARLEELLASE